MLPGQCHPTQGWGRAGCWLGSPGEMEGLSPFSSEAVPRLALKAPQSCTCTHHRDRVEGAWSSPPEWNSQWLRMQILSKPLSHTTALSELVKMSSTWAERG